jgi:hypothetical protein
MKDRPASMPEASLGQPSSKPPPALFPVHRTSLFAHYGKLIENDQEGLSRYFERKYIMKY